MSIPTILPVSRRRQGHSSVPAKTGSATATVAGGDAGQDGVCSGEVGDVGCGDRSAAEAVAAAAEFQPAVPLVTPPASTATVAPLPLKAASWLPVTLSVPLPAVVSVVPVHVEAPALAARATFTGADPGAYVVPTRSSSIFDPAETLRALKFGRLLLVFSMTFSMLGTR